MRGQDLYHSGIDPIPPRFDARLVLLTTLTLLTPARMMPIRRVSVTGQPGREYPTMGRRPKSILFFLSHLLSDIRHQTSDIRHQTSDIRHQTSDTRPQTPDTRHQTSDISSLVRQILLHYPSKFADCVERYVDKPVLPAKTGHGSSKRDRRAEFFVEHP